MTSERLMIKQRLKDDFVHYAVKCLKIRTKSGGIEPLVLNKAQLYIHSQLQKQLGETGKVRALVLKSRQQGCSTYIGARFYHKATWYEGMQSFIMCHSLEASHNLYKMAQRFYEYTPDSIKIPLVKSNAKELIFDWLHSGYKLGTAENKNVGRSSTIQLLHWSETAFSANTIEHSQGIMQSVSNAPGTEIILESTPNGIGNFFHQEWQKAEAGISDYVAIFVPWYWQDEYAVSAPLNFKLTPQEEDLKLQYNLTDDQVYWRRKKIIELSVNGIDGEKSFRQEYSSNANEAFILTGEDSFINSDIVISARNARVEAYGPLLVGVDPARFGDDRTSIICRQGRVAFGLQTYVKKDLMEVAGIVHRLIESDNPAKVFIDIGGLGAGLLDRLRELGHGIERVIGVNAGSSPLDGKKYKNKRAEMWGLMKEWLMDGSVKIPDDNALHADLCGIKYKFDSNSRLQMESKEDMKKRGIRSPDMAEALCQTFAYPESAIMANKSQSDVLNSLAGAFDTRIKSVSRSRQ